MKKQETTKESKIKWETKLPPHKNIFEILKEEETKRKNERNKLYIGMKPKKTDHIIVNRKRY